MKFLICLLILFPCIGLSSTLSSKSWLKYQWDLLPADERPTIPSSRIFIDSKVRRGINLKRSHLNRNHYLNSTYAQLAREFSVCFNSQAATWYNFGHWASRSSGKFISGESFQAMDPVRRIGQDVLGNLQLTPNQEELAALLGRTNFIIGVEMIPLGQAFLKMYCSKNAKFVLPFSYFEKLLPELDRARSELREGFRMYHQALTETRQNQKIQLIAYGTVLLMMGEQRRAQANVDAVFRFAELESRGMVEYIYRGIAAASAGLEMSGGVLIPFNKDITSEFMHPALKDVPFANILSLHRELGVPLYPQNNGFKGTAVSDWGNLRQRLRFLVAVVRGHITRPELSVPSY
jgi:hypothetical protein